MWNGAVGKVPPRGYGRGDLKKATPSEVLSRTVRAGEARATVKHDPPLPPRVSPRVDDVGETLFSLANDDRLVILRALQEGPLKLTQIAKRVSATPQEASRHLTRLTRSALIERGPSGAYGLTHLGGLALRLMPAWEVVAAHRDYFLSHDLLALPGPFLERIGDLSHAKYEDALTGVLAHTEAAFHEAREYVWLMSDQVLSLGMDPPSAVETRGLRIRSIVPSRSVSDLPDAATHPQRAWPERFELGLLDEVRFGIAMNERSAGVVFADPNGKLDFNRGFRGPDPAFHGWCRDLFEHHWARVRRYRPL